MAESEEGRSPVEFSTAINLLRQATNILSELNSPTNTTTTSNTTCSTPTTSNRVSLRHDERAVLTNFRGLWTIDMISNLVARCTYEVHNFLAKFVYIEIANN